MVKLEDWDRPWSAMERVVASRLRLNLDEVVAGSIRSVVDSGGPRIEWLSTRSVEAGFMESCWEEANRT